MISSTTDSDLVRGSVGEAMANDNPLNRTRNRVLFVALLLYLVAALAYAFVTTIQSTGLGGLVVAWQFALMGWASLQLSVLCIMAIFVVPLLLADAMFRRFSPEAAKSFRIYQRRVLFSGFPSPMTWAYVFKISGGALLLGGLVCGYLFLSEKEKEKLPVRQVDVSSALAGANLRSGYVELTGTAAEKYTLVFRHGGRYPSTNVYVPVVEPGWTPSVPVRYFVHYQAEAYHTGPPDLPYQFVAKEPSMFPGKLRDDMAEEFKQRYTKRGLRIAPDALFVDWEDLPNHHVAASHDALLLAALITIPVVFFTLLMLTLAKLQNDYLARKRSV